MQDEEKIKIRGPATPVELKTGSNAVKACDRTFLRVSGSPFWAIHDPNGLYMFFDSEFLRSPYLGGSFFQVAQVINMFRNSKEIVAR